MYSNNVDSGLPKLKYNIINDKMQKKAIKAKAEIDKAMKAKTRNQEGKQQTKEQVGSEDKKCPRTDFMHFGVDVSVVTSPPPPHSINQRCLSFSKARKRNLEGEWSCLYRPQRHSGKLRAGSTWAGLAVRPAVLPTYPGSPLRWPNWEKDFVLICCSCWKASEG